ncbi:unnamed protein product [Urochloa humidicola]
MEAAEDLAGAEQIKDDDAAGRLTYEIFSLLEAKFLFGGRDAAAVLHPPLAAGAPRAAKVCVLSIDGGARLSDGLLAAAALVRLEAALRRRSGSPAARLADFFDVAAGSGAGGVLAALLFARGAHGRPLHTAEDALAFLLRRVRRRTGTTTWPAVLRRRGDPGASFGKALGDLTLRETVRPLLVPCYDLSTRAPFLFSRADATESAAHDFRLRDVCAATTCATGGAAAVEVVSVDGGTRIRAVGGGTALGNPTAAAITHVLNNRREFPAANTVDDLLVISIGTGEATGGGGRREAPEVARIAAESVSDMVDQAVAMAFGHSRTSNYVRIQGTGSRRGGGGGKAPRACGGETREQAVWKAEAMLLQRSVESVLFQGRKLAGETNAEKIERFARDLAKEHARRKQQQHAVEQAGAPGDGAPPVVVVPAAAAAKQTPPTTTTKVPHKKATLASPSAAASTAGSTEAAVTPSAPPPRRRRRAPAATSSHC